MSTSTAPIPTTIATQTVSADAPPVIETRGLRKTYGGVVALERLDLSMPRAAVGLLGANGAGKTTLLRLLLGLSTPSSGSATVLGFDTRHQGLKIREHVGYMPESDCLPPGTTAADFVGHMAEMSGLPPRAARQRAADVLYQVGLDEERYRLIKGFSTGMKQRVKLAQSIVHDPDLVFLDEPTNGLDPQGRDEMLDLIGRIHRRLGITVVVSSHILTDIERVCDYVVILNGGRLILSQPIGGPTSDTGDLLVRVEGDPGVFMQRLAQYGVKAELNEETVGLPGEMIVRRNGDQVFDAVRDAAVDLGVALRSMRTLAPSLEDLYLGNVQADEAAKIEAQQTNGRT